MSDSIDLRPLRGWVTTAVIASTFGIHPRTIQRLNVTGKLPIPAVRFGHEWRYPLAALNRYLVDHGGEALTDDDIAELNAIEPKRAS